MRAAGPIAAGFCLTFWSVVCRAREAIETATDGLLRVKGG